MAITIIFSFTPSDTAMPPFSFSFTVEDNSYNGQCVWNMARQDWYLQLFDASQNMIINHPLVSSPIAALQNLAPGIFSRSIIAYTENIAQIIVIENPLLVTTVPTSIPYIGQQASIINIYQRRGSYRVGAKNDISN